VTDSGLEIEHPGPAPRTAILARARDNWAALAVAILGFLLLLPPAVLPGAGLDPSWTLAVESAAREGRTFGVDFLFTYGPWGFLSTRLFDPHTYAFALLGDFTLTGLFLVPLLWSRRPAVLVFYLVAILAAALAPLALDARVAIASLVICLIGLRDRSWWVLLAVLLFSPVMLSKFSYALAALPLFAIADLYRLIVFRRLPLLTITGIAVMVLGMMGAGHALGELPALASDLMLLISGYSGGMQAARIGGIYPLLVAYAALFVILGLCLFALWRRDGGLGPAARRLLPVAAVILAVGWTLFMALKMGHTRQDLHIFITWHAFAMTIAVMAAFLDGAAPLRRIELISASVLMAGSLLPIAALDAVNYIKFTNPSPVAYLGQRAKDLGVRPFQTLAWLWPGHWSSMAEQRRAAEALIAARLPVPARGTMDVIPYDLAPVIVSGTYRPRPVPQSYSSYTPRLQELDAAHFDDSARAPETLFLKLGDIDERLPTLATGPSLPVIARWYDAVGASPLGLILHRRAAPRNSRSEAAGQADFGLGDWVNVPPAGAGLILARIEIGPNLVGRALGFFAREPMLWITLRYDDGAERTFRFIPGMGRAGFVLSPMPLEINLEDLRGAAALIERAYAPDAVRGVVAFRFSGSGPGANSFTPGHVAFDRFLLAPGFAAGLPAMAPVPAPAR
jgi:hypothetical protein